MTRWFPTHTDFTLGVNTDDGSRPDHGCLVSCLGGDDKVVFVLEEVCPRVPRPQVRVLVHIGAAHNVLQQCISQYSQYKHILTKKHKNTNYISCCLYTKLCNVYISKNFPHFSLYIVIMEITRLETERENNIQ